MDYIPAKTILSPWHEGGWFGCNYTMNLYKGCCHGCIYCDSRSECYQIQDFDRVRAKENALETVARDLRSKRKKGMVITGSMSDAYNPFEEQLRLTRGALQLLDQYGFGVAIDTKSPLVTRDIDRLQSIRRHSPVAVSITITTADDRLCQKLERRVAPSSQRFEALKRLSQAGIPSGVLLMPLLPFINDTEENVSAIVNQAAEAGAKWIFAYPDMGVTLRQNQRGYFYDRIDEDFPGIKEKYMRVFGNQYECASPNHERLWQTLTEGCQQEGLLYRMEDIAHSLHAPYRTEQLSWL
ncbi:MAG: radical SAM protein [Clostridiales bacterium]|nr:radical SAM protein [Clostridiales bacterium]